MESIESSEVRVAGWYRKGWLLREKREEPQKLPRETPRSPEVAPNGPPRVPQSGPRDP